MANGRLSLNRNQIEAIVNGNYEAAIVFEEMIESSGGAAWLMIDFTSSSLADIQTRPHSAIQSILGADDTSVDTAEDKHVSNAMMKAIPDHAGSTVAHGSTGDIVGRQDYASASGGVVLLSLAVADAPTSVVSVTSPNAVDLATVITLANEMKVDMNQLVTDVNLIKTQLNALLASQRAAKQLAP